MSTWAVLIEQIKQFVDQQIFFAKNKIQRPKEVLVIVARSRPRKLMNKSSRVYR